MPLLNSAFELCMTFSSFTVPKQEVVDKWRNLLENARGDFANKDLVKALFSLHQCKREEYKLRIYNTIKTLDPALLEVARQSVLYSCRKMVNDEFDTQLKNFKLFGKGYKTKEENQSKC